MLWIKNYPMHPPGMLYAHAWEVDQNSPVCPEIHFADTFNLSRFIFCDLAGGCGDRLMNRGSIDGFEYFQSFVHRHFPRCFFSLHKTFRFQGSKFNHNASFCIFVVQMYVRTTYTVHTKTCRFCLLLWICNFLLLF